MKIRVRLAGLLCLLQALSLVVAIPAAASAADPSTPPGGSTSRPAQPKGSPEQAASTAAGKRTQAAPDGQGCPAGRPAGVPVQAAGVQ